jgi:hypothetical protein
MLSIGAIPQDGGGAAIRYGPFGGHAVVFIGSYLFHPEGGVLRWLPLPDWLGYAPIILIALLYSLLVTLPLYFYFRTRRSSLLLVQVFALALHSAFALLVVAPFWIGQ